MTMTNVPAFLRALQPARSRQWGRGGGRGPNAAAQRDRGRLACAGTGGLAPALPACPPVPSLETPRFPPAPRCSGGGGADGGVSGGCQGGMTCPEAFVAIEWVVVGASVGEKGRPVGGPDTLE